MYAGRRKEKRIPSRRRRCERAERYKKGWIAGCHSLSMLFRAWYSALSASKWEKRQVVRLPSLLVLEFKDGHERNSYSSHYFSAPPSVRLLITPSSICHLLGDLTHHVFTRYAVLIHLHNLGSKSHVACIWRVACSCLCLFGVRFMLKWKTKTMLTAISLSEPGNFDSWV